MKKHTAAYMRKLISRAGLNQCSAARAIGISPRAMRRYVSEDRKVYRQPPTPVVMALEGLGATDSAKGSKK